jgi:beta-lactam-binding protein with PASTA domain
VSAPSIVTVALEGDAVVFPDLRGFSAREAVRQVALLGMSTRLQGAGLVVDQDPLPGSRIERGGVSTLRLAREVPATAVASAVGGP